jgi:DNA polymerase-4
MTTDERAIVHMDLDTFFVSCERLLDHRLIGKPVLIGGTSDRGVVASCSYEARRFGIHSAMPMRMAKNLCPEAIVLRGNTGIYTKFSNQVTEVIKDTVPLYEKSSVDEFYIDLSGMDRFFGCRQLASELRQKIIKETGLPISFGLSANKTVSKIATGEAKPNNEIQILKGNEKPFLAPLSVKIIPLVWKVTFMALCVLGVYLIQTMQEMPVELLQHVLGKHGSEIW